MARPIERMGRRRALAGAAWLLVLTALVQAFFFFDWGQGPVRAGLLVFLGLSTLGAAKLGLGRHPALAARAPWVDRLAWAALALHAGIALFITIESLGLLASEGREGEMGGINYRALRLVAQRVSPYASRALLDEVRYRALVTDGAAAGCLEPSGEAALARFDEYWRSVDPAQMAAAWPRVVGPTEPCRALARDSRFLGLKYGPVLLATYAPFVVLLGKAGIRVSHLAWLVALCLLLASLARRAGAEGGLEVGAAVWLLLVPNLVRFDTLRHTDCDLAPVLLGVLAFALLEEARPGWAGLAVGLSVGAKLLPGLLLLPLLLPSGRRSLPAFLAGLGLALAAPLALDREGFVANVLEFGLTRAPDSTALAAFLPPPWRSALSLAAALAMALTAVTLLRAGGTSRARLDYLVGAHLALFLGAPVLHNNYLLWLLPWLGLWLSRQLVDARAAATAPAPGMLAAS
jgi:hypothetical protein